MKTILVFLIFVIELFAYEKHKKITIAGPFATVSHPFFHMIKTNSLDDVTSKLEFKLWKNPDEMRALVLNGDIDFIAVPSNVAATLYNKKIPLKLLNISVWGILGMLTRDKNLKTLKDFRNKTIGIPFRADMPDIIFKEIVKKQGLTPNKDFNIQYYASPIDAMQMLILRRLDHVLLAEPAISIALRKTHSFPLKIIAPELYRSADLQKEWGKTFNSKNRIPQAGVIVLGKNMNDDYLIKRFEEEYKESLKWYKNNPKKAGKLIEQNLPMLNAQGVSDSISYVNIKYENAQNSKKEILDFFNILMQSNPKIIGNEIPQDDFFYKENL